MESKQSSGSSANPRVLEYIDLHSHLLPGVDDGCEELSESVAVARESVALGCRTMVCTPHIGTDRYLGNTPVRIAQWVDQLQQVLDDAGIELRLIPCGEFRLSESAIAWFEEHGVPTLGKSNVVLIDTWARAWETCYDEAIEWLFAEGYQPLLAHPERMLVPSEEWQPLVDRMLERGVWLQGNFKSFGLADTDRVQTRAWRLLERGHYTVLASDTHALPSVSARADGLSKLKRRVSAEVLQELIVKRPKEILSGAGVKKSR